MSIKSEVFTICRNVSGTKYSAELIEIRNKMSRTEEVINPLENKAILKQASQENKLFFRGFLILDSALEIGGINDDLYKNLPRLNFKEKQLFCYGDFILTTIYKKLIDDTLSFLPENVKKNLDPYKNKLPNTIRVSKKYKNEIDLKIFNGLYDAFEKSNLVSEVDRIYKRNSFILNSIKYEDINEMMIKIEGEMFNNDDELSSELWEILIKKSRNGLNSNTETMYFYYLVHSIDMLIKLILSTIYNALIGGKLNVINESNIIKIENITDTMISRIHKYILMDSGKNDLPSVGEIVLMDYEEKAIENIVKEFGLVTSLEHKMVHDSGNTMKVKILKIDDEMNIFYKLIEK